MWTSGLPQIMLADGCAGSEQQRQWPGVTGGRLDISKEAAVSNWECCTAPVVTCSGVRVMVGGDVFTKQHFEP